MLKREIKKLVSYYGLWRLVNFVLVTGIVIPAGVLVLEFVIPVGLNSAVVGTDSNPGLQDTPDISEILGTDSGSCREFSKVTRPGLFRALSPLTDKPMADKTIERIVSQLKLQCIMEMGGERVAYINIKGIGLRKCSIGDSVNELFTVLSINEKSVDITIIDHKVTLSL